MDYLWKKKKREKETPKTPMDSGDRGGWANGWGGRVIEEVEEQQKAHGPIELTSLFHTISLCSYMNMQ